MRTNPPPLALAGSLAELEALDPKGETKPASSGGPHAPRPPRRERGVIARLKSSAWTPLVGRGAAIVAGLLLFAGIGVYSAEQRPVGVHVASQVAPGAPVTWLAPTPSAEKPNQERAREPAPSEAPALSGFSEPAPCSAPGVLCDHNEKKQPPAGLTKDGKVILNIAGAETLTRLPGVGERRAEAIVKLRTRLRRFRRPSDLLRVRGIGVRSLKRMLPHLVLDPPASEESDGDAPKPKPKSKPQSI